MPGERVHSNSSIQCAGGYLAVIEVGRKSDDEMETGGDSLDGAGRQVAADRGYCSISAGAMAATQHAKLALQSARLDQLGEGQLRQGG